MPPLSKFNQAPSRPRPTAGDLQRWLELHGSNIARSHGRPQSGQVAFVKAAADALGVSRSTIQRLLRQIKKIENIRRERELAAADPLLQRMASAMSQTLGKSASRSTDKSASKKIQGKQPKSQQALNAVYSTDPIPKSIPNLPIVDLRIALLEAIASSCDLGLLREVYDAATHGLRKSAISSSPPGPDAARQGLIMAIGDYLVAGNDASENGMRVAKNLGQIESYLRSMGAEKPASLRPPSDQA